MKESVKYLDKDAARNIINKNASILRTFLSTSTTVLEAWCTRTQLSDCKVHYNIRYIGGIPFYSWKYIFDEPSISEVGESYYIRLKDIQEIADEHLLLDM